MITVKKAVEELINIVSKINDDVAKLITSNNKSVKQIDYLTDERNRMDKEIKDLRYELKNHKKEK